MTHYDALPVNSHDRSGEQAELSITDDADSTDLVALGYDGVTADDGPDDIEDDLPQGNADLPTQETEQAGSYENYCGTRGEIQSLTQGLSAKGVNVRELVSEENQQVFDRLADPAASAAVISTEFGIGQARLARMARVMLHGIMESVPEEHRPQSAARATAADGPTAIPEMTGREITRWGHGQRKPALDMYRHRLEAAGHTLTDFLPAKASGLREAAPLLVDSGLTDTEIAQRLGVGVQHLSDLRSRLLDTLHRHVPEPVFPYDERPAPETRVAESTVGEYVGRLIRSSGKNAKIVGQELGIAQPRMSRLITGATTPDPDQVLVPLLDYFKVPMDVADELLERYDQEIETKRARQARRY